MHACMHASIYANTNLSAGVLALDTATKEERGHGACGGEFAYPELVAVQLDGFTLFQRKRLLRCLALHSGGEIVMVAHS